MSFNLPPPTTKKKTKWFIWDYNKNNSFNPN